MHWWQIRKRRADLERELDSDLALEEEEQRERGVSADEARYAARRAFGNTTLVREQTQDAWGTAPFERLVHDIRFALRQLGRSRGFTLTSILILALGIGAVTAVFSLINTALLRMLPVHDPEHLVEFKSTNPDFPVNDAFSMHAFKAFQGQTQTLAGVLAFRNLHNIDIEVDSEGGLAEGQLVSGSYFSVLGVNAILGRTILPSDETEPGQNPVAVIGYDYWRTRFALDPAVLGKRILINNAPFTVIGVTAPEFYGLQPGKRIAVSIPLTMVASVNPGFAAAGGPADALKAAFRNWLYVFGRLQSGVSIVKATSRLEPVYAQTTRDAAASLAGSPIDSPAVRATFIRSRLQLQPGSQGLAILREQFSRPLLIVLAVVALLLLITCANVASLLLSRANAREREFSVRLALGAGKRRLFTQLFTESILLAIAGGILGVALAWWGSRSLLALMAHGRTPVSLSVQVDLTVLGFALAVSLLTAVVFGTIPAWRAAAVDPQHGLAQNSRTVAGVHSRLGKSLVVLQIAISLVLLVGAGLFTRTLANLRDFYPGFNPESVLLFSIDPTLIGNRDVVPLYEQILNRVRQIPGVRSASLSVHEPLSTNVSTTTVRVQGAALRQGEDLSSVAIELIGPDYFTTLQIPLLRGREFFWQDREGAPKVAIVNETTARHYFGDADPIGRSLSIPGYRGDSSWLRIVGVARDIKVHDVREPATLMLYVPMFQAPEGGSTFEVRTSVDPATIENAALDAVKSIDPRLPLFNVRTLAGQRDNSLVQQRLVASFSEFFGAIALLLTCIGLYGLMAYTVSRRTGEIGIRMALGAQRGRIARMILRETLLLVAVGLVLGLPAAGFAARLISGQLFGLKPADPVTFAAACAAMAAVAILASYLPARRAASVDPMHALRNE